eukprot:TRINITY_DN66498_c6_g4_i2.p1 TRINITY_DN66498_c6_g4~~TRINITY_DN66498_c6_g4_i2.p1  ORF type:complete len:187 (+),score=24.77 TRINITY_DN66498_c6_g4_i2:104-664(+)
MAARGTERRIPRYDTEARIEESEFNTTFVAMPEEASSVNLVQVNSLKKGSPVMLRGRPCKLVDYTASKPGKHGSAKAHLVAFDIFTDNKIEMIAATKDKISVPVVQRAEVVLMDIVEDQYLVVMQKDGSVRSDLKLPENQLGDTILKRFYNDKKKRVEEDDQELLLTTLSWADDEAIVALREGYAK